MRTQSTFNLFASQSHSKASRSMCTSIKQTFKTHLRFLGPGLVASVAYCDPGNWATDLGAGSSHGYAHLFVILSASVMASVLQVLATRLGFITGKDLAQHCRDKFYDRPKRKLLWRWGVLYPLYFLCEGGIIFTDLAELLGSAIALHMLFPRLPLFVGVLLTSMDVFVVLAFFSSYPDVSNKNRKSMHMFEVFVSFLIFVVISFFIILLVSVKPEWGKTFEGFIPNRRMIVNGGLYVSVSLIGATVMPHSIFLGSKVAIPERMRSTPVHTGDILPHNSETLHMDDMDKGSVPEQFISIENPLDIDSQGGSEQEATVISLERTKRHLAHASFDIVASLLTLALPVNASILIVASATFFYGSDPSVKKNESLDLQSAYELLGSQVGPIAGYLFAIALLIAGQAASITVTLAGQIVSEGFLEWRTRPVIRRLVTRMIGIVPSAVVAGASGLQGVDHLMVGSQVGLSLVLPFVLAPLIILTSDPKIMRVKGHDTDTVRIRPTEVRPDFELPEGIENYHQSSKPHVKEEAPEYSTVCFANGRIVKVIIWSIFVLCSLSNIYAIVQLAQGQQ
ncbi:hypothetical protein PCANC_02139 [Puccinia coronata f. sp. avenae]|uniref:Uncharacterized protein n=1 Tax=Puccinia coronata f. sp. avenae TaxID=200324 RepID=A0A2N5VZP2_9BASI|nr:hypothetical protein PCASD_13856 [Puccinia coronata f. sp. avenae]PLW55484.1 hypothetical protein PCANC_02139 [Puccinia coronata f. sp. avenae]